MEPIINALTGEQFLPQNDGNSNTARAKAIMSYACQRNNNNSFFEPVDIPSIFFEFAVSSGRTFLHDITPGGGLARAQEKARTQAAPSMPRARVVTGQRFYVSGIVNQTANSGELRRVEPLGKDSTLDASYASGYYPFIAYP